MKIKEALLSQPLARALVNEDHLIRALFNRPESLSALLPYDEFIESNGIFRNRDGSLGAVFEVDLLEHEPMNAEAIVSAVEGIRSWFTLPENCVLQILFDQAALSERDDEFSVIGSRYRSAHPVSKALFEARLFKIQKCRNSGNAWMPLKRRTLVSIRYFPHSLERGLAHRVLDQAEATLFKEMKSFVQEIRAFSQIITNFQHNSKVKLNQLKAEALLDYLRRFFNPRTYYKRSFAPFNPALPISDQVLYHNPTLDFSGIEREGIKTRTLSLKTSPHYAYPGGVAYFLKLPFPFKLSISFSFPSKAKVKTFFDLKEFFLQNTPSAKARHQREEVLEVQDRLARDDRCLHMTFNVIVEGENDEILDARVREIVNVFHNDLECETIVEEDIGLGLCLNALPLNYTPKSDYSTKRAIRILRSDAIKFIPLFDSFRGLREPLQLYLSRENNLVRFSLLENETSNHTVVLADSGSGKSAFIIDCIQAAKRMSPEPLIFVIDKKSSYTMLSEYFDADFTVFDRSKDMPFSPFRGVYDEDKIAFLTGLISSCVKLSSPSFEIDSIHTGIISKALKLAYQKKVQQAGLAYVEGELLRQGDSREVEISMDDFVAELGALPADSQFEGANSQIEDLIQRLAPFCGDGTYARYFRGKSVNGDQRSFLTPYIVWTDFRRGVW